MSQEVREVVDKCITYVNSVIVNLKKNGGNAA